MLGVGSVKVRVIKKSESDNWYKINKVYNVIEETECHYMVSVLSGILKEDAEVVEDVEKSCNTCGQPKDQGGYCSYDCNNSRKYWKPIESTVAKNAIVEKQATGTTEEAKHYQVAEVQPIEVMQMYLTPEEMIGGLKWQVIKYILRIGHKGSDREDAGKCNQYSQWLCDVMDGKTIVPGGK